jgi:hypothetical protein
MEVVNSAERANANLRGDHPVRTTVVLPIALDRNLEIYCAKTGKGKSKVIERILFDFLAAEGLQPDRTPKSIELNVSY